jgi:hypothetical protein
MKARAQCLCGSIKYQVFGSLGEVRYCHCFRCRQANGTAFSANAKIAKSNFHIISGKSSLSKYEMSKGVFRYFCSVCGSPIYVIILKEPEWIRIRIGALEGEVDVKITGHVWVGSKSSWYVIEDSLPCFEEKVDEK